MKLKSDKMFFSKNALPVGIKYKIEIKPNQITLNVLNTKDKIPYRTQDKMQLFL